MRVGTRRQGLGQGSGYETIGQAGAKTRLRSALEAGTKQLVAWPDSAQDLNVWLRPEETKRRVLESLRAKFGYAPQ